MNSNVENAKLIVLNGCKLFTQMGLTEGTAGNISARVEGEELFVITPTSMDYATLKTEDMVVVDYEGNIVEAKWKPSIEVSMHRKIFLLRPDVKAIVHSHSSYATAYASTKGVTYLPPIDIEAANYLGGDIMVAEFAIPGSLELAENVAKAIGKKAGVLMENHGAIGVGKTMEDALTNSSIIEKGCHMVFLTNIMGGMKELDPSYKKRAEGNYQKKVGLI